MNTLSARRYPPPPHHRQQGIVLFFALIAIVALMLTAAALVRSVDTSTIIAGNLAFRQSATASGDGGVEAALAWLQLTQANNLTKNVLNDSTHAFNIDDAAQGYYSSANPALDLFSSSTWSNGNSALAGADPDPITGNTTRYIIQRMCRNANTDVQHADCLLSGAVLNNNNQVVPLPQEICSGPGCPSAGQSPEMRITARIIGPKNTVSYVQAFVY